MSRFTLGVSFTIIAVALLGAIGLAAAALPAAPPA